MGGGAGRSSGSPVRCDGPCTALEVEHLAAAAGKAGSSRKEIRDLFNCHESVEQINQALTLLSRMRRVRHTSEDTGGQPTDRWFSN
jgi:hypothetical protein